MKAFCSSGFPLEFLRRTWLKKKQVHHEADVSILIMRWMHTSTLRAAHNDLDKATGDHGSHGPPKDPRERQLWSVGAKTGPCPLTPWFEDRNHQNPRLQNPCRDWSVRANFARFIFKSSPFETSDWQPYRVHHILVLAYIHHLIVSVRSGSFTRLHGGSTITSALRKSSLRFAVSRRGTARCHVERYLSEIHLFALPNHT